MTGTTKVVLPYYDENEMKYTMITLSGPMYASKMYSIIKEFVNRNFGVRVDKDWLIHVPVIHNSNDTPITLTDDQLAERIELFVENIEHKDDEDKTI